MDENDGNGSFVRSQSQPISLEGWQGSQVVTAVDLLSESYLNCPTEQLQWPYSEIMFL